jgi:hypothetical protein
MLVWQGQVSEEAMFLRVVRAAGGKGVKHEYVRVVEAYRQRGKTHHRTVLNLGRRDLLAAHLDLNKLTRLLHGDAVSDDWVRRENVQAIAAWDFGPMLAAGHLWRELSLEATLDRLVRRSRGDTAPFERPRSGAGRQSIDCAGQRARLGALAGDRLCLRSRRPPLGAGVAR